MERDGRTGGRTVVSERSTPAVHWAAFGGCFVDIQLVTVGLLENILALHNMAGPRGNKKGGGGRAAQKKGGGGGGKAANKKKQQQRSSRQNNPMGKRPNAKNAKNSKKGGLKKPAPKKKKEEPATAEDLDSMMSDYWSKGKPEVAAKHLDDAMDTYFANKPAAEEGEKDEEEK